MSKKEQKKDKKRKAAEEDEDKVRRCMHANDAKYRHAGTQCSHAACTSSSHSCRMGLIDWLGCNTIRLTDHACSSRVRIC